MSTRMTPATGARADASGHVALPPVGELVPHAGAMLLLDALCGADDEQAVARTTVRADQLFIGDGAMPAWVGIEYMAQTIAAWAGARDWRAGNGPRIGFLLGTRRYECDVPAFPVGSELTITVRVELIGDNGLGMFACALSLDGRDVARANVSVFQPADARAFMQGQQP